jgi:hypothetical protein
VPEFLTGNFKLMVRIEVLLMLTMLALGIVNRPAKQKAITSKTQTTD